MDERISEAELADIVGRTQHAWQHEPGAPDLVERLRLVAEVRRLRGLIVRGAAAVAFIDEFRDDDPSDWDAMNSEAEAIRAEQQPTT